MGDCTWVGRVDEDVWESETGRYQMLRLERSQAAWTELKVPAAKTQNGLGSYVWEVCMLDGSRDLVFSAWVVQPMVDCELPFPMQFTSEQSGVRLQWLQEVSDLGTFRLRGWVV